MSAPRPPWPLGLARLAAELDRDLQRAARAAGGPEALWVSGADRLGRILGVDAEALGRALLVRRSFRADEEARRLAEAGVAHVGLPDAAYPRRLAEVYDPPFGLFARGDPRRALARIAEGPAVAIVGARRATAAGCRFARELAGALASRGAVVVSGLAQGIDSAAHEGVLERGGLTVAVLGSGVDVAYPRRNRALAQRIAARGLVVSEYWPGTRPAPWRFPARNRIVAGLSQAVVVVEAGARSGALITADLALEQGRAVLAVPGFPGAEASVGCNALLRAGAALCEGPDDVEAEVPDSPWTAGAARAPAPAPIGLEGEVHRLLVRGPLRPDELLSALGAEPGSLGAALARLELDGRVLRGEGGRFWAAPNGWSGA
jgi:DNA processing protein